LSALRLDYATDQVVFDDYRAVVRAADERVKRLEVALRDAGPESRYAPMLRALQAMRGVGYLTAITIVAEVGTSVGSACHFVS
jgi:transposase